MFVTGFEGMLQLRLRLGNSFAHAAVEGFDIDVLGAAQRPRADNIIREGIDAIFCL